MTERAVGQAEHGRPGGRTAAEPIEAAQDAELSAGSTRAVGPGVPPPDGDLNAHRSTLQRLPSPALRQQFVRALARQYGNAHVQRLVSPTEAPTRRVEPDPGRGLSHPAPDNTGPDAGVAARGTSPAQLAPPAPRVMRGAGTAASHGPAASAGGQVQTKRALELAGDEHEQPLEQEPEASMQAAAPPPDDGAPSDGPSTLPAQRLVTISDDVGMQRMAGDAGVSMPAVGDSGDSHGSDDGRDSTALPRDSGLSPAEVAPAVGESLALGDHLPLQDAMPLQVPSLHDVQAAAPSATRVAQRAADDSSDSGGLLAGIRARLASVAGDLRSGWSGLRETAASAFGGLQERVGGMGEALGGLAARALDGLKLGWSQLREMASSVTKGIEARLQAGANAMVAAAQRIAAAAIQVDPGALQAAWSSLVGVMGGLRDTVQGMGRAALAGLSSLWTGLRQRFSGALTSLGNTARSLMSGLSSAAQSIRSRLAGVWAGLQGRASQLSGVLGRVPGWLRSAVDRLLQAGRRLWGSIQSMWGGLQQRLGSLWQGLQARATSLWESVRGRATSLWQSIGDGWNGLRQRATAGIQRLAGGVGRFWQRISSFSIGGVIERLAQVSPMIRQVREALKNPRAFMEPIVTALSAKLKAEVPGKSEEAVRDKLQEQGSRSEAAPQPAEAGGAVMRTLDPGAGAAVVVMRQPEAAAVAAPVAEERSTESFGDVWDGVAKALRDKWEKLDVVSMLWDAIKTAFWPWEAIGHEFSELWGELKASFKGLFAPRGLSDPLGMLHDLWSNLMHLADIPLVISRRLVNVVGLLAPLATIALMVLGAFGISLGAGVLAGAASAGTAAAPAAGAGGLAGAGAGLGTALALGRYLFMAFLLTQGAALVKALVDLLSVRQTDEEKHKDYNQATDSGIALGIAGVLVALAHLAAFVGRMALPLLRKIPIPPRLRAAAQEFGQGVKAGQVGTKLRLGGLTEAETEAFARQFGIDGTKALLDRYGAGAMKHYGPDFFKNWKGVTQDTINHLLQNDGIKKGEIKGCHDRATFEAELKGKGEIVSETPHPKNPDVARMEYKLYQKNPDGSIKIDPSTGKPVLSTGKPKLKTVIKDLTKNQGTWKEIGNQAAEEAIKNKTLPQNGGEFTGTGRGTPVRGFARDGEVKTFFPDF